VTDRSGTGAGLSARTAPARAASAGSRAPGPELGRNPVGTDTTCVYTSVHA
jgi:hypothetical protein